MRDAGGERGDPGGVPKCPAACVPLLLCSSTTKVFVSQLSQLQLQLYDCSSFLLI